MLFLAFIFKRGAGYGDHAILRSLITLQDPRRNLYAPIINEGGGMGAKVLYNVLYNVSEHLSTANNVAVCIFGETITELSPAFQRQHEL